MRANLAALCLSILAGAAACPAQTVTPNAATGSQTDYSSVYCSGFVSDSKVPDEMRLISGEQANYQVVFSQGDFVYLSHGQDKGVKIGDRFMVMRAQADPLMVDWFKGQAKLLKSLGTHYIDAGHLRVVSVQAKTSIAQVTFSCDYMQRGDVVRPFEDRPAPPFKDAAAFDHFAPVNGKPVGSVVAAFDFASGLGRGNAMYMNLGAAKGVKVGDYVRVFRNQGTLNETAAQTKGYQYQLYGFGSTPARYEWKDLPRELLGEAIVLSVSKNASTALITYSSSELYVGDYVEVE
ncbi:MAG TPA: hypothetical protein VGI16_14730 [Candidatus Acidoferrum sp.]|jgi:hypothetical protein